jgi:hypothetical protein
MNQKSALTKAAVYLDGLGSGDGESQVLRLVIYTNGGRLVAASEEVTVEAGQEPDWVDFNFLVDIGKTLTRGDYFFAVHAGDNTRLAQIYGDDPHGFGGMEQGDEYDNGPSDPFSDTAATARVTVEWARSSDPVLSYKIYRGRRAARRHWSARSMGTPPRTPTRWWRPGRRTSTG